MLGLGKKKKGKKGETPDADGTEAEKLAAIAAGGEDAADGAAEGEGAPKKKGLPIKLIAIAAAVLVVLGGGGVTAFLMLHKSKPGAQVAHTKTKAKAKDGKAEAKAGEVNPHGCTIKDGPAGVTYCSLPVMITNTKTTEGRPNNLKLQVTLELADPATGDVINEQMPHLNDLLQTFLRELRPEDLAGSAGDTRLRWEIQQRVNLVIAPAKVNAVLIEDMLQS